MATEPEGSASNVVELLEWFEDVVASNVSLAVALVDTDVSARIGVLRKFYERLVAHPHFGGAWPARLPHGSLAVGSVSLASPDSPRMLWLGLRASAEPITEPFQLVEQLTRFDHQARATAAEAGDTWAFEAFSPAIAHDVGGGGDAIGQAFSLLADPEHDLRAAAASTARVLHEAFTGHHLLRDGGALRLDGPSQRTRALMAASWLMRLADRTPIVLVVDEAQHAGPFVVELVAQLHRSSFPVLVVLSGSPTHGVQPSGSRLAGPFAGLDLESVPARALPGGAAGRVGTLLALEAPRDLFTRAHVAACAREAEDSVSIDNVIAELCAAETIVGLGGHLYTFVSPMARAVAAQQAASLVSADDIDASRAALSQLTNDAFSQQGTDLERALFGDAWDRAAGLAREGEFERAAEAVGTASSWHAFARATWSQLAGGRRAHVPLEPLPSDDPHAVESSAVVGNLAAGPFERTALEELVALVERIDEAANEPHDGAHAVRVAAVRGLLMLGDVAAARRAAHGLRSVLPPSVAHLLDHLAQWQDVPGVVRRSAATIENLNAIALLRNSVAGTPALGHLLLSRLEMLDRFGRLEGADDAELVAAEAINIFRRSGPGNVANLWRARRLAAWVTQRGGDHEAATAQLHALIEELAAAVGGDDARTLAVTETLARCELEAGWFDEARDRLDDIVAQLWSTLAPNDPQVLSAQHWRGIAHAKSNRHVEAADILRPVVELRAQSVAADDEDLLASRVALGLALINTDQLDDAYVQLDEAFRRWTLLDLSDAPNVIAARHARASCLMFAGRHAEAFEELNDVVRIRSTQLAEDDPLVLNARNDRGLTLLFLGRWAEALEDLDYVIRLRERTLGSGHLHVLVARQQRAMCLRELGLRGEALREVDAILQWTQSWEGDDAFRETLGRERAELAESLGR